jgi:hypothetical protein
LRHGQGTQIMRIQADCIDDRGREKRLGSLPPPSEPDRRVSRIRLSSRGVTCDRTDGQQHGRASRKTARVP